MDVSIILVSYNTKDLTRDCLRSIYEKTQGIEFEIFVVDNNSHDGSPEMIEQEFPEVRLIRNSENKGFGAANNIAIRQSNAKYIFCLNTDTILLNNAVKIFFDFMEQPENRNVGACGGNLLDKNMNYHSSYGKFPSILRILWTTVGLHFLFPYFYRKLFFEIKGKTDKSKFLSVDYITGADLFLRKRVINEVGAFDEDFFMYFEDTELCLRISKAGFSLTILPLPEIIHLCSLSVKNIPLDKIKMFRKSELLYFKKLNGPIASLFVKYLYVIRYFFDIRLDSSYIEKIKLHIEL